MYEVIFEAVRTSENEVETPEGRTVVKDDRCATTAYWLSI